SPASGRHPASSLEHPSAPEPSARRLLARGKELNRRDAETRRIVRNVSYDVFLSFGGFAALFAEKLCFSDKLSKRIRGYAAALHLISRWSVINGSSSRARPCHCRALE